MAVVIHALRLPGLCPLFNGHISPALYPIDSYSLPFTSSDEPFLVPQAPFTVFEFFWLCTDLQSIIFALDFLTDASLSGLPRSL